MADDIVRPSIVTAHRNGYYSIRGIDASTPAGERLSREFEQAPSAEDLVGVMYEAIEHGVRFFTTTGRWMQFNPALVVSVECRNFE